MNGFKICEGLKTAVVSDMGDINELSCVKYIKNNFI